MRISVRFNNAVTQAIKPVNASNIAYKLQAHGRLAPKGIGAKSITYKKKLNNIGVSVGGAAKFLDC